MRKGFFNLPLVLFALFAVIAIMMFAPSFVLMASQSASIAPDAVTGGYYNLIVPMGIFIAVVTLIGLFFIA